MIRKYFKNNKILNPPQEVTNPPTLISLAEDVRPRQKRINQSLNQVFMVHFNQGKF